MFNIFGKGTIRIVEYYLTAIHFKADGSVINLGMLGQWYDPEFMIRKLKQRWGRNWRQHMGNPMADVVTYAGLAIVTNTLVNLTLTPKYAAWGTGAGTALVTDTTLFTEAMSTSNTGTQNIRPTSTLSQVTTTRTNDTFKLVTTITADTAKTIKNHGQFDTNGIAADLLTAPSGGNLCLKTDFADIGLGTSDSIQFTDNLKIA